MKSIKINNVYNLIFCLAFTLLAGCAPDVAEWTPPESPKKNKVERTLFFHTVSYSTAKTAMEEGEKIKLIQFIKNTISNPSAVTVTLSESGGHSESRIKTIKREFLKHGIPHDFIMEDFDQQQGSKKTSGSGVEITVEKYVIIPPSCSNFSQNIGNANQASPSSNFGCAIEANLGMMIANPRDLIQGRTRGDYDGTVLSAGVKRYQEGKTTPLMQTSTRAQSTNSQSNTPNNNNDSGGASGAAGLLGIK